MSSPSRSPETSTLLDERVLADLHEDFASTGELDQLAELIGGFVARAGDQVAAVAAAARRGDAEAARAAAHKLKGSSLTLGAGGLGSAAARIESSARSGDVAAARRAVPELERVLRQTRAALAPAAGLPS